MTARVPPRSSARETRSTWASRSQTAFSSAALAMRWPRTWPEDVRATAAAFDVGVEQARREFGFGDDPGGVDGLVAEVGMLAGDALAPGGEAVGFESRSAECGGRW